MKPASDRGQGSMSAQACDVVVIGGGPAGSTAAALLARRGYGVIALEKAHHPRFHIGESLLPMNLPLFDRLGVLEKVRALGVFKRGADFEADNERGYNTFAFDRALGKSPPHAYQVWRQDFDRMLYAHARECGADTREGHEAIGIEQRSPRDSCLEVRTDEGRGTGNCSYDSSSMGGPGWVLIGDAFAFIDPVFSSGVYLAMSGAEQAAQVVDAALREPAAETSLLRRLEKRQRAGMERFSFFIYRFNEPVMRDMFRHPRNALKLEQSVISMLAGDLFDTPRVLWPLQPVKLVHGILALRDWRRWRAGHRDRLAQARAQFTGGNTPLDKV